MPTTETKPVQVLASHTGTYTDRTSFIAEYLGRRISDCRGSETIKETAIRVLSEHGVALSTTDAARIRDLVMSDTVFDSEERMATRAALAVLVETFDETMRVTGWIDGRRIARDGDVFILINEACPRCEVNPLAHVHGGGHRCLNTRECGYSFCH